MLEVGKIYTIRREITFGISKRTVMDFHNEITIPAGSSLLFLKIDEELRSMSGTNVCWSFLYNNKIIFRFTDNTFEDWFEEVIC